MKKLFLAVAVISLAFISCSSDDESNQPIIYPEKIYEGDVTLISPLEIEQFGANNYTKINGSLTITDPENAQHITHLNGLNSIGEITQNLIIQDNPYLEDLSGLTNLTTISSDRFENFGFIIDNNALLSSLSGLENLTLLWTLTIKNNANFSSLHGIENVALISGLTIKNNTNLSSLNGLENVSEIYTLFIENNANLSSLNGLNNLSTYEESVYSFYIENNITLTNFCALPNFEYYSYYDNYVVYGNAYNPTYEDLENGNCSI